MTIEIPTAVPAELSDEEIVRRVLAGDAPLFEILMRRHNQRLYRVVLSILRDDGEAEDVMQEAYVRAYQHLAQFEGRAKFVTWLSRIAVHEALARTGARKRLVPLDSEDEGLTPMSHLNDSASSPEEGAAQNEIRGLLERAILALPFAYRTILVMRDVEEASTLEAAESLGISVESAKVRLHRARALLRRELSRMALTRTRDVFAFHATRCDRVVSAVLLRIQADITSVEWN